MEQRRDQLSSITTFIHNTTENIDKFLADLGWDRDTLLKEYNNGTDQQIGLKKNSDEDSFPESFYNEQHPCSVKIDEHTQATIIRGANNEIELAPQTEDSLLNREIPSSHKDLLVNFTRDERLALYQYAVESTPKQKPLPEFQISFKKRDKLAKLTPLAEIAAYRRDIRRRNQKYRVAKNPLTYQEEMRNLIQLQTEALAEYLGQPAPVAKSSDKTSEPKTEGTSRTRSRSRERKATKSRWDGDDSDRSKDAKRKKRKRSRSRSRSGHRHKSKKSKRDDSRERGSRKHKSRR